jgi:hypothetical protein
VGAEIEKPPAQKFKSHNNNKKTEAQDGQRP